MACGQHSSRAARRYRADIQLARVGGSREKTAGACDHCGRLNAAERARGDGYLSSVGRGCSERSGIVPGQKAFGRDYAIHRCGSTARCANALQRPGAEGMTMFRQAEPSPIASTKAGRFGAYGGRYVPETLMSALEELESAYASAKEDAEFQRELDQLLHEYAGRPTPLFYAARLTKKLGGAQIYLKREDLLHTGAHKINNCLGQGLLAQRMGKRRIIAETGAGQHGVATATVCALLGFECVVYMGSEDMRRQELNVFRMRLLGAEVRAVNSGSCTLKDAINEAMRDWVTNVRSTHYLLGSVLGAHPYPEMVR